MGVIHLSDLAYLVNEAKQNLPLKSPVLVHCVTNEITSELVANAILFVGGKPVMADDPREFRDFAKHTDSLLLNLGHLSKTKQSAIVKAGLIAYSQSKPIVLDLVGIQSSSLRYKIAHRLSKVHPAVIKGNFSELRAYCDLHSTARGVDGSEADQTPKAITELRLALEARARKNPQTLYLATGATDLLVCQETSLLLINGVSELECFTGSGDLLGGLIAALLGAKIDPISATVTAVSYLNCCGEIAQSVTTGLASFRHETLDQLSLLSQKDWSSCIKGKIV